jgi:exopolysaccharide production protein ExoZ
MIGSTGTRLSSIEALRGVAATAVVLSHAARHVDKIFGAPILINFFQAGHAGVDLFFTISGFIILFVHRSDIGETKRLQHYLVRRFNRVLPLYWIALALTLAISIAGGHSLPAPMTLLWSAALLPTLNEPLLGIAWTLQFEVVFYALFAVLIVSRNAGQVLLTIWLLLIAIAATGFGAAAIPSPLCGIFGLEFFMGMASAQLLSRGSLPVPRLVAGTGLGLFVAALVMESIGLLNGFGIAGRFAYGIPAALLILGVAATEQDGQLTTPNWLRVLGGASYSIYLFQFVFIGVLWQILLATGLDRRLSHFIIFLALACAALGGGIIVYPVQAGTRKSLGEMTRKLSVTVSQ